MLSYADVAEMGRADMEAKPNESFTPPDITDIATLVYTRCDVHLYQHQRQSALITTRALQNTPLSYKRCKSCES